MTKMRKVVRRFFALILTAVLIVGMIDSTGLEVKAADMYTFRLINSKGEVVRGNIDVKGNWGTWHGTITLSSGIASDKFIAGSTYEFTAAIPGYTSRWFSTKVTSDQSTYDFKIFKEADCIIKVIDQFGNPISGATVNADGQTKTTGSDGTAQFQVNEIRYVTATATYGSASASGNSNGALGFDGQTITLTLNRKADVKTTVTMGGQAVTDAKVTATGPKGTESSTGSENGEYNMSLVVGDSYDFAGAFNPYSYYAAGYTVNSTNASVADGTGQTVALTAALNPVQVVRSTATGESGISSMDLAYSDTAGLCIKTHIKGASYRWSTNSDVISLSSASGEKIDVTAQKPGTAKITVTTTFGTESKSTEITVNVSKKASESPAAPTPGTEETDRTSETFTLPDSLTGAGKLTIIATGDCIKDGSYETTFTDLTAGGSLDMDLSGALADGYSVLTGPVTYSFVYTSDNYDYTSTPSEVSKTYYKTVPLEVSLTAGGTADPTDLIYGDSRTVTVVAKTGSFAEGSSFSYDVSAAEGVFADLSDYQVPAGTAAGTDAQVSSEVIINQASPVEGSGRKEVVIQVTRAKDETNYWAQATAQIPVTVYPKEINPLTEAVFANADTNRVYNEERTIDAVGTINAQSSGSESNSDGKLTLADNGKVQIEATLALPLSDADTYKAPADAINIKAAALKASGDLSQEFVDRNYILKSYSDTDVISSGTLTILPAELSIQISEASSSGSKATAELFYQDLDYGKTYILKDFTNLQIILTGLVGTDTIDGLDIVPVTGLKDIGTYTDALYVDLDAADNKIPANARGKKNYSFASDGHTWADLMIKQEQIDSTALDNVLVYSGEHVYIQEVEGAMIFPGYRELQSVF